MGSLNRIKGENVAISLGEIDQKTEMINCDLCYSRDYRWIGNFSFYGSELSLVSCAVCGLAYTSPRLHSSELKKHFQSTQGVSEKAITYMRGYKLFVIKQIIKYLKEFKQGKLLDIGSSCGLLLNEARRLGWEVYGVEISLPNAEYSHRNYGLNVFNGYLHEAKFPNKSFKVVTIIDTLYYCYHPVQELKEIYRILEDGGLLLVRYVNRINYIRAWQTVKMLLGANCHLSRNIFFEGMNDHLYFFDIGTLRKALDAAGFRDIKFFNGAMAYKVKGGSFINNVRRIVVQLFDMVWWLSGRRMCFAPSVIVIARK